MFKRLGLSILVIMFLVVPLAWAADIGVAVDSRPVYFPDQQPFMDTNGRVQVPIRYVMENMNVAVTWNEAAQSVTLYRNGTTAIFTIGSPLYTINGQPYNMDTIPIVANNRTCFPVRYAAEAFGARVTWDNASGMVNINTQNTPSNASPDGYPLSLGGLLPGQSLDQAIAVFGNYTSATEDPELSSVVIYKFGDAYIDVLDNEKVVGIRTSSPDYKTGLGIAVGDSVPELWAAYGDPASIDYDSTQNLYSHRYSYVESTDTGSAPLVVGTGYYHILFWCNGTSNRIMKIESKYGYR